MRCTRDHEHEPCNAKDALHSQGYTPLICFLVHIALMQYFTHRASDGVNYEDASQTDVGGKITSYSGYDNIGVLATDEDVETTVSRKR